MIIENYHATNESRRDDMILDVIIKLYHHQQTQNGWHDSRFKNYGRKLFTNLHSVCIRGKRQRKFIAETLTR
jgi:hypothetical protein